MKKKKNRMTTVLLLLILLAGIALLLYPSVSDYWNSFRQSQVISNYAEQLGNINNEQYQAMLAEAREYNELLLRRPNEYLLNEEQQQLYEALLNVTGVGAMGYIEIPSIGCTLPIYHGTSDAVLQIAVGHLEGSSLPVGGDGTHCVLSGHRGLPNARLFTNLDQLVLGDLFTLRVLDEAVSPFNPVFEQMKFLSISASNLDEFFMIRVGSLWDQIDAGYKKPDSSGLTPREQVSAISQRAHVMMKRMYTVLRRDILPGLAANGITFADIDSLTEQQAVWLDQYYDDQVYPVLTPMAVDAARPFPLILSRTLNIGLLLETEEGEPTFATVQVPSGLNRVITLPGSSGTTLLLLEDIVARSISSLFHGRKVICCAPYRITRNADMSIDEEDAADLLAEIEKSLKQRRWGAAVRLEIDYRADDRIRKVLMKALELEESEVYAIHGPINLDFLMREVYKLPGHDALKYSPYSPRRLLLEEDESMFSRIAQGDLMLYHPYDSFDPVIQLIHEAARDPKVLAIKQTLYRVSSGSPIIAALIEAAEAGKRPDLKRHRRQSKRFPQDRRSPTAILFSYLSFLHLLLVNAAVKAVGNGLGLNGG